MRPTANGKGSYDAHCRKGEGASPDERGQQAATTCAAPSPRYNLDFGNDVLSLADQGFEQLSIEPVVLPTKARAYALSEGDAAPDPGRVRPPGAESTWIAGARTAQWFNFFHFMVDLDGRPLPAQAPHRLRRGQRVRGRHPGRATSTPATSSWAARATRMGSVLDRRPSIPKCRSSFAANTVLTKEKCCQCWARFYLQRRLRGQRPRLPRRHLQAL